MRHSTRIVQVGGLRFRAGRRLRGRPATGLTPACEPLDGRQLLSTVAAAPAMLPAPSAAAVANAAAELNARDPSTFARLQGELAQAEGDSPRHHGRGRQARPG